MRAGTPEHSSKDNSPSQEVLGHSFPQHEVLLGRSPLLVPTARVGITVPLRFYTDGYAVISGVDSPLQAQQTTERFIAEIDPARLVSIGRFRNEIRMANWGYIPVCEDSVTADSQALHFDMGLPVLPSKAPQNIYALTALYLPVENRGAEAATRIVNPLGMLAHFGSTAEITQKLVSYADKHGDGWIYEGEKINTGRLAQLARFVDAVVPGEPQLSEMWNQTMAEWFRQDSVDNLHPVERERNFFNDRGIDIQAIEHKVVLEPGQLLIINNLEVAHGRAGKRKQGETLQLMYGILDSSLDDIKAVRAVLVGNMSAVPDCDGVIKIAPAEIEGKELMVGFGVGGVLRRVYGSVPLAADPI